ncbi:uncharacterized protein YjiS (DUF1127 family) [Bradyrhizobium sp. S3.12.5]|uniref:hypothetical protein n=1 Tax=Bradyrhizobium sp. S3.12.5 TaxID=3156386 RepID=UPI0033997DED
MRSQALQTSAQAAVPDRATVIPATGSASGDNGFRIRAILSLPATWWQRSRFRTELRADLRDKPELLHDIGIGLHEAHAEASRFFWEAVLLQRR